MRIRTKMALGSIFALALFITVPFLPNHHGSIDDLFMHLASELIGITITVAIVDQLLEQERNREDARRLSWRFLRAVDQVVWVWQGGGRVLNISELRFLLSQVQDEDPLPPFTENMFLNVAGQAEEALSSSDHLDVRSDLYCGLQALVRIVRLYDQRRDWSRDFSSKHIAMEVEDAVARLSNSVGLGHSSLRNYPERDCSEARQKMRYEGLGNIG